jgi:hypothetical protein
MLFRGKGPNVRQSRRRNPDDVALRSFDGRLVLEMLAGYRKPLLEGGCGAITRFFALVVPQEGFEPPTTKKRFLTCTSMHWEARSIASR